MPHVGTSVDEGTKEKWSKYVEESDYGSMSELLRAAVRKEIRRDDDGGGLPREAEKRINQIAENQQQLASQMGTLSDDFTEVSEAATTDQYPEHIIELSDDVAGELDEVPAGRFGELESEAQDDLRGLAVRVCDDPTKAAEVGEALDYLSDTLSYVKTAPQGPSDYYRVRRE